MRVCSTALRLVTAEFDEEASTSGVYRFDWNVYICHLVFFFFVIDQTALIAVHCLALLLVQTKIKNATGDVPFIMKIVPVSS